MKDRYRKSRINDKDFERFPHSMEFSEKKTNRDRQLT